MEKTLYYKVVIRKFDAVRQTSIMKNEGFLIAKITNNKIVSLEGVFTFDYVTMEVTEDMTLLKYYVKDYASDEYELEWIIELEEIELPFNMQAYINLKTKEKNINGMIQLKTKYSISKTEEKLECEKQLSEVKNVFQKSGTNRSFILYRKFSELPI